MFIIILKVSEICDVGGGERMNGRQRHWMCMYRVYTTPPLTLSCLRWLWITMLSIYLASLFAHTHTHTPIHPLTDSLHLLLHYTLYWPHSQIAVVVGVGVGVIGVVGCSDFCLGHHRHWVVIEREKSLSVCKSQSGNVNIDTLNPTVDSELTKTIYNSECMSEWVSPMLFVLFGLGCLYCKLFKCPSQLQATFRVMRMMMHKRGVLLSWCTIATSLPLSLSLSIHSLIPCLCMLAYEYWACKMQT